MGATALRFSRRPEQVVRSRMGAAPRDRVPETASDSGWAAAGLTRQGSRGAASGSVIQFSVDLPSVPQHSKGPAE